MRLAPSPWMLAPNGADASTLCTGAVVTPTRVPGLAAALRRWFESLRDGWRGDDYVDTLDAATLRDIGLSHTAAAYGPDPHAARRAHQVPL
jgi:hypothetical protein